MKTLFCIKEIRLFRDLYYLEQTDLLLLVNFKYSLRLVQEGCVVETLSDLWTVNYSNAMKTKGPGPQADNDGAANFTR